MKMLPLLLETKVHRETRIAGAYMSSHIAWLESRDAKPIGKTLEAHEIKKATILLVEDDDIVREAVSEFLQAAGYPVLNARTPNEAVALFCQHPNEIKVLIADLALPGQNGRRLSSYLKELQPGFQTIFISGYPEHVIARGLKASAGHFYLAKPFPLGSLLAKIEEVGAEKEQQAEGAMRAACIE